MPLDRHISRVEVTQGAGFSAPGLTFSAARLILRSVPPLLAAGGRCVAAAIGEPVWRPRLRLHDVCE